MRSHFADKVGAIFGIALMLLAILGFLLSILLSLPTSAEVESQAAKLKDIPADLFSAGNQVNQTINGLRVPSGVPVKVDPNALGRRSVFESF